MNQFDRAQEADAKFLKEALKAHLNRGQNAPTATHCVDCGEEIPAARRAILPGCQRCTLCQEALED